MFTIDLKILATINKYSASREDARYYLNGVHVEANEGYLSIVATDGHRLIAYKHDISEGDDINFESFIIPRKFLEQFKFKKKENSNAEVRLNNGVFSVSTSDGMRYESSCVDGTFPDWRRVLPQNNYEPSIASFNGRYAHEFDKFSSELFNVRSVIVPNGDGPALVNFGDISHCYGVIMPVRSDFNSMRQEF